MPHGLPGAGLLAEDAAHASELPASREEEGTELT